MPRRPSCRRRPAGRRPIRSAAATAASRPSCHRPRPRPSWTSWPRHPSRRTPAVVLRSCALTCLRPTRSITGLSGHHSGPAALSVVPASCDGRLTGRASARKLWALQDNSVGEGDASRDRNQPAAQRACAVVSAPPPKRRVVRPSRRLDANRSPGVPGFGPGADGAVPGGAVRPRLGAQLRTAAPRQGMGGQSRLSRQLNAPPAPCARNADTS